MDGLWWFIIGLLILVILYFFFDFIEGYRSNDDEVEECPKCGHTYYVPAEYHHDEIECYENQKEGRHG